VVSNDISILFLITARGGSKGVPNKNLKKVGGLSLTGYKAISAQNCAYCKHLILSTDSEDIRTEGLSLGLDVPFIRPGELATDTASSDSVVKHAMNWVEHNHKEPFDAIMLLEPASPFATAEHYERAIELFITQKAELVVGVREMETPSSFVGNLSKKNSISNIVTKIRNMTKLRRQDQETEVTMNGTFYLIDWQAFKQTGRIYNDPDKCYGILMDRWHSVEIETPEDLVFAEFLIEKGYINMQPWTKAEKS